jgi:hypothetical protein
VGALAYILPFIEQGNLYNAINPTMMTPNWTGGAWWGVDFTAGKTVVKTYLCPSDSAATITPTSGTFVFFGGSFTGTYYPGVTFGPTNYAPNAGMMGNISGYTQYMGPYDVDSKTRITDITDGTSNTIGFGEVIGGDSETGARDFIMSWMGAGDMVSYWGEADPAVWYAYAARHTSVIQFAYCDGSVRSITKGVANASNQGSSQWYTFQYACGMQDGAVYSSSVLGQ